MKIQPSINTYALLALFLSPWKNEETIQVLAEFIQGRPMDWGRLLYMANLHFCAPLWYVRLKADGLLRLLPEDLQIFLEHLHQANTDRQNFMRQAAEEIVLELHHRDLPVVLLKGAATFCDDLYDDPGARMMGDLDLLLKAQHLPAARKVLAQLGYREQPDHLVIPMGFSDSQAPHHLPRYLKPGTPVAVEIHFQTAPGQAGRVLSTDLSWANAEKITWAGANPSVLRATHRLLHNTVHALVSKGSYIETSIIPLGQLAEFAYLVHRYDSQIDWREWLARGAGQGMRMQFKVYLTLAHRLMGMPLRGRVGPVVFAGMHVSRVSQAGSNWADNLAGTFTPGRTAGRRLKDVAIRIYIHLFRRLHRPAWDWQNLCYKPGLSSVPHRLLCLASCYLRRATFKRGHGGGVLRHRIKKAVSLMKKPGSAQS